MIRRLAFLLRPGWIALALVVAAFTYLAFTVLAPWQLGKNTKTSRENQQIEASLTADPVPVTTFLPQQDSSAPDAQWRRVTATGRYIPDTQVLVRLRVIGGAPAYEALAAFAVDGGPTILVNRGYAAPEQGTAVPPIPAPPSAWRRAMSSQLRMPPAAISGIWPSSPALRRRAAWNGMVIAWRSTSRNCMAWAAARAPAVVV